MTTAPAATVPVVGLRSVFAGHSGRKNAPFSAVMLYECRAWPSQPTIVAPTPTKSTESPRRVHRRRLACRKYADSSADEAEWREWRDEVRGGEG
jgi:hypothetical protein